MLYRQCDQLPGTQRTGPGPLYAEKHKKAVACAIINQRKQEAFTHIEAAIHLLSCIRNTLFFINPAKPWRTEDIIFTLLHIPGRSGRKERSDAPSVHLQGARPMATGSHILIWQ